MFKMEIEGDGEGGMKEMVLCDWLDVERDILWEDVLL